MTISKIKLKDNGAMHNVCICISMLLMVLLSSCSCDQVDLALHLSGDNRDELECVLRYFENDGDKEKIAASRFLIGNMLGHKSMWGDYRLYWRDADRILSESEGSISVLDSLENLKTKYEGRIYYDYDLKK